MIQRLQALLQWMFLQVEGLFNRAFGDRLNPIYHLGAISFYLFWLVAGSGLYLYAFFETGVAGAYDSVEALTHHQWFAGGVLRSIHRYASDAMVLTMLLHMLRHFAFDRFRGFRWFSWVSGVSLIWGVYISGINGYMLPWDKLAQFVIVASFEWLDWLPGFGGTLVRNFIYTTSVNDRFFSLLSFMHIGIPLVVLLLMWIHVQRVPKARTNPPRPIMISVTLMLLVMCAVKPVLSQGGAAQLDQAVPDVQLDWFYLAVFPLLYLSPLGQVWALLVGASTVLALLPWLPPRWRRGPQGSFQMHLHGSPRVVSVRQGETLLEAGLRAEIPLPFSCRSGGCGQCRASLLNGRVNDGGAQAASLTPQQRQRGDILLCCACALSDVEIEVEGLDLQAEGEQSRYTTRVVGLDRLSPDVMRLTLALMDGRRLRYQAGQYIQVVLEDGQRRAYSFTAPGDETDRIELHVRLMPGGRFTTQVFERMKLGDELQIEGPIGAFVLREPSPKPVIFVAGATGFAPVKSLLEEAFRSGIDKPLHFYWGVRRPADLYLRELPESWAREHANFHFVPVISEPDAADGWNGRTGLVHEAILQDFPDLSGHLVYACGSLKMVEAARPAFVAQGLSDDACFSDAFTPAAAAPAQLT
ncbi:MAG: cytochrome b N-terminal domain-containing protein [Burkholderiales bacterium]|nr:cytochrome b N-terminal domain-containing protein [Burkholderiales bacterium]